MIMRFLLLFSALLAMTSCSPKHMQQPVGEGSELGFSINLFRTAVSQSDPDANVTVSPYSAGVALSMLAEGAGGQTAAELDNALNGCRFVDTDLGNNDTLTVKSANSVWMSDDFSIRNTYVARLSKDYGAFADVMNFASPETVHAINNWCSENTVGMIKDIVKKIDPQTVMILANALYFNAPWEAPFDPRSTHETVFHGSKGDSESMFMSGKKTCGYVEYKGNQMVALPYKDGRYAMYILLPAENLKESDLLSYMSESGVDEVMKNMSRKKVKLTMPKFKVEHEMSLVKTLEAMGVRSVFTSAADLTGIAHGPLAVSDVFQKTVVDVDESGSEAAAVTTIMVNMTSARIEPDPVMTVDRPFYYMIADMDAGRILFAGRMMNL